MECFLDDFRASGINAYQWTTVTQDEEEWRRTVEQRAEHFHDEMDRCSESQGWTMACSIISMPEREGKEQGEDRIALRKQTRAGSLAIYDCRNIL